jgi:hypothetical protein
VLLLLPLTFVLIFAPLAFARAKERAKTNAKVAEVRTTVLLGKKIKKVEALRNELFQWPIFLLLKKRIKNK